jgi:nitrogenase-stabilizing/protective protein
VSTLAEELGSLESAEAFMEYFDLAYDARTLNVNRLHILKRFNQYLARAGGIDAFEPGLARERCRTLLAAAYRDFVASSGIDQKVFRVFQRAQGEQRVHLSDIARSRNDG